jgi:hypothetical protein
MWAILLTLLGGLVVGWVVAKKFTARGGTRFRSLGTQQGNVIMEEEFNVGYIQHSC